jgi:flagellar motor switch/type III secretory pathway protein FliN
MSPRLKAPGAFPWESLDSWRRGDIAAWRDLRGWIDETIDLRGAELSLANLLGVTVTVRLRSARRGPLRAETPGTVGLLCAPRGRESTEALLLVEGALAARLVALALKRPPPRMMNPGQLPTSNLAGAVAALIVAASRHGDVRHPVEVLSVGQGSDVLRALRAFAPAHELETVPIEQAGHEFDTATFTVTIDEEAFTATVIRRQRPIVSPAVHWSRAVLRSLGELPIDLPIVACATVARMADVASLRPGDAWMPGTWPLSATRSGPVWLAAPGMDHGVRGILGEDGQLVLRNGAEEVRGPTMSEPKNTESLIEAVGEMPVVVRVEVGSATMKAREWAELREGDVVTLRQRIADPVALRVNGIEVAKGELVNIEGEVGVRILSRRGAGETA